MTSWPLAVGSQLLYLLAGFFLPVFAGSSYGIDFYTSPTAAYVFAFTPAAALLAYYRQRTDAVLLLFLLTLCAHLFILICGSTWIMSLKGHFDRPTLQQTFIVLLPGALMKSALAVILLVWTKRLTEKLFVS